jgi:SpoVK/Ycf46/Vps4 family AAA+-type ATPase
MGDEFSIREIFQRAREEAPCILVLEDLDSIITDPNRSFFLNEVDGINENDGILMVSASPTGLTGDRDDQPLRPPRPGSVEPPVPLRPQVVRTSVGELADPSTFPNPTKEQRQDYARYWQNKLKDNKEIEFPDDLVGEFADKTDDFSFAYMKEAL